VISVEVRVRVRVRVWVRVRIRLRDRDWVISDATTTQLADHVISSPLPEELVRRLNKLLNVELHAHLTILAISVTAKIPEGGS
jgi:hypothetical protein